MPKIKILEMEIPLIVFDSANCKIDYDEIFIEIIDYIKKKKEVYNFF
jgi:hypothetical protein